MYWGLREEKIRLEFGFRAYEECFSFSFNGGDGGRSIYGVMVEKGKRKELWGSNLFQASLR